MHEARLDRAFRAEDKKQAQRELARPSGKHQQERHLAVGQRDRLKQPQVTNLILLLALHQYAAGTAALSEGDNQIQEKAHSRLNGNLSQHSPFHSSEEKASKRVGLAVAVAEAINEDPSLGLLTLFRRCAQVHRRNGPKIRFKGQRGTGVIPVRVAAFEKRSHSNHP